MGKGDVRYRCDSCKGFGPLILMPFRFSFAPPTVTLYIFPFNTMKPLNHLDSESPVFSFSITIYSIDPTTGKFRNTRHRLHADPPVFYLFKSKVFRLASHP